MNKPPFPNKNQDPKDPKDPKNQPKAKMEEPKEAAEDSVPLRVIVFLMAVVCVGASCILSHSNPLLTGLYIILVASGSFLSYQHRHDELKWLHWLALAGILFVGAGVLREFMNPLRDEFDFVSPFIHFLAGVFAFITFEMRTRSDLNLSSSLGLFLLLLIAPVEKGLPLLAVILIYIILGTFMLYYDCLSETLRDKLSKPITKAPEVKPPGVAITRRSAGHTVPALMMVPLLSVVLFIFSPRSDDVLDKLMAAAKSFDPGMVMSSMLPPPPPTTKKLTPEEEQRARAWFQKRGHNLSKIDPKDEKFKKRNASEDVDYIPPRPSTGGNRAKPQSEAPAKEKQEKKSQSKANKKNDKNQGKNPEKNPENNSGSKENTPPSAGKPTPDKNASGNSTAPGSGGKGSGSKKKGKGTNDKGSGGGGGGSQSGEFVLTDDKNLTLFDKFGNNESIILVAKTRRIVYFRRRCFDVYTGVSWEQSQESEDNQPVKVTNGEIKKEFKVNFAPPPGSTPSYQPPVVTPTLLAPGQSTKGGLSSISLGASRQTGTSSPSQTQSTDAQSSSQNDSADSNTSPRKFIFQDQDKPLYRVSMADALKIPDNFPSIELLQEMKVKAKSIGKYVPGAWIPQEVRLFNTTVTVDNMGAVSAGKEIERGCEFKVKTQLPMYDLNKMRLGDPLSYQEEEDLRNSYSNYLDLPKSLPQSVFELAEHTTNPQYNWFVQCEQLSEHLRRNYKYDITREVDEQTEDCVAEFLLKRKTGHCTDFASAFVVLARCVGIPARLVTGFGPGTLNNVSGEREIKVKDLYTWAEAYVPGSGWVPFDPSPEGFLPDVKKNDETTMDQMKESLGLDKQLDEEETKAIAAKVVDWVFWGLGGLILLVVLILCLRFLIPLLKRLRKSPYKHGPEWAILVKVQKTLEQKLKQPRLPSETPQDFIDRLRASIIKTKNTKYPIPRDLPETLSRFYKAYSEVYFGQRKEKLEDVKEYGKQVLKVISGKVPIEKSLAPKRKSKQASDDDED